MKPTSTRPRVGVIWIIRTLFQQLESTRLHATNSYSIQSMCLLLKCHTSLDRNHRIASPSVPVFSFLLLYTHLVAPRVRRCLHDCTSCRTSPDMRKDVNEGRKSTHLTRVVVSIEPPLVHLISGAPRLIYG